MYHILVVDDEKLMRTYLTGIIPSFTDKFQVSGAAKDGLEAIELLKKQHFDVVITDIKMPEVDGLCLAKYVADNCCDTIVIIISGYSDFAYARSAIQYRVTDYLLKPLVDQDLAAILETVGERLDKQQPSEFLTRDQVSNEEELRQALFGAILEENAALTYELFHKMKTYGFSGTSGYYMLVKCIPDTLEMLLRNSAAFDVTTEHLRLNQLLQDICKEYESTVLYSTDGATYILLNSHDESLLAPGFMQMYHTISAIAHKERMSQIIAFGSRIINDIMKIPHAMQDINDLAPLALSADSQPVLYSEAGDEAEFIQNMHGLEEQVYTDYLICSVDNLYMDIGKICSLLHSEKSFSVTLRLGCYLIQMICGRAQITLSYRRKAYDELFRQADLYLPAGPLERSAGIQILTNAVCALMAPGTKTQASESSEIIARAKKYILSHYQENISLSNVADHCKVNSSYLSDLFHKTLKEPYTKYLLRIRMEQAAKLLKNHSDIKIYTVAEQTGFVSVKHFNTVFKKYYGMTPTEFIKKGMSY